MDYYLSLSFHSSFEQSSKTVIIVLLINPRASHCHFEQFWVVYKKWFTFFFFHYFIKIFGRLVFERRKSEPKPDSTDRIIERRRSYYANLTYFMGRVLLEIVMAYDQRNEIKIIIIHNVLMNGGIVTSQYLLCNCHTK